MRSIHEGGASAVPDSGAQEVSNLRLAESDRVMVIAPHPDDESLAASGLLLAARSHGAAVRVVYMTDGDNNPWAQLVNEGRWPRSAAARTRWGARRRREALAALGVLGVPEACACFLGFPDQGLTELLIRGVDSPGRAVLAELDAWRPTLVVGPSLLDRHPDHSASALFVRSALARFVGRRPLVVEYSTHRGPSDPGPRKRVPLGVREVERKRNAILCHVSQLWWRRKRLLGFIENEESFDVRGGPRTLLAHHPV